MGHKIHPTGFRLGIVQEHRSRWFAEGTRYPDLLEEDYRIREYVQKTLSNAGIADIRIERKADQIDLELRTARPGVVVGRGGAGIETLRLGVQKLLKDPNRQIRVNVVEVSRVDADAALVAEQADGVILLVSLDRVDRDLPREAISRMRSSGAPLLGLVTNSIKAENRFSGASGNGRYGYGSYGYGRYGKRYGYGSYGSYDYRIPYGHYTDAQLPAAESPTKPKRQPLAGLRAKGRSLMHWIDN